MTVRDTSLAAFASVAPHLNARQAAVLTLLERSHALTNSEIARELGWKINTVTPRTNELVSYGLVQAFGKRKCRVTGRTAYAWGVSKDTPAFKNGYIGELIGFTTELPPKPRMVAMPVTVDGVRMIRLVPEV